MICRAAAPLLALWAAGCHLLLPLQESSPAAGDGGGSFGRGSWSLGSPVLVDVNSAEWDGDPVVTGDGRTLYFGTFRLAGRDGVKEEIFRAIRDSKQRAFASPERVLALSTTSDEGFAESADGRTAVLVTDRIAGNGQTDIWMATRTSLSIGWESAFFKPLDAVNSTDLEYDARPSPDGRALYFSRFLSIADRQHILWARRLPGDNTFGPPVPLAGIDEDPPRYWSGDPALSPDQRVLVFGSAGRDAEEPKNSDLWYAIRVGENAFSAPRRLPGVNTAAREQDPFITADGRELYFSSDRNKPSGDNDIYKVDILQGP